MAGRNPYSIRGKGEEPMTIFSRADKNGGILASPGMPTSEGGVCSLVSTIDARLRSYHVSQSDTEIDGCNAFTVVLCGVRD